MAPPGFSKRGHQICYDHGRNTTQCGRSERDGGMNRPAASVREKMSRVSENQRALVDGGPERL